MITKIKSQQKKLWSCPKCGRKFERRGQTHSCRSFALAGHFDNKPFGKILYNTLKQSVKNEVGPFKVESLECCIHFVSTFTFAAVKIFKDRIRVDFSLNRRIKNTRVTKSVPMSAHRFLYCINVFREEDIAQELIDFIHEANEKKSVDA